MTKKTQQGTILLVAYKQKIKLKYHKLETKSMLDEEFSKTECLFFICLFKYGNLYWFIYSELCLASRTSEGEWCRLLQKAFQWGISTAFLNRWVGATCICILTKVNIIIVGSISASSKLGFDEHNEFARTDLKMQWRRLIGTKLKYCPFWYCS